MSSLDGIVSLQSSPLSSAMSLHCTVSVCHFISRQCMVVFTLVHYRLSGRHAESGSSISSDLFKCVQLCASTSLPQTEGCSAVYISALHSSIQKLTRSVPCHMSLLCAVCAGVTISIGQTGVASVAHHN